MVKKKDKAESLQILFTEQVWEYGFMAYIAETGGFVGLFLGLGWSLLQMEQILVFCLNHKYGKYPHLGRPEHKHFI